MKYTLIILFMSSALLAQIDVEDITQATEQFSDFAKVENLRVYGYEQFDSRKKGAEGSPLLTTEWQRGKIDLTNGHKYTQYLFRFNIADNSLIVKLKKKIVVVPNHLISSFVIEDLDAVDGIINKRPFKRFETHVNPGQFLEVLVEGPYTLLKGYDVEYKRSNYNPVLDTGRVNDKIIKKEIYYVNNGDKFLEVNDNKKKTLKSFKADRKLHRYLENSKIKTSKEEDLILFIHQVNSDA